VKVGVVCPYDLDRPGGVQAHCLELVAKLHASGWEAVLIGPGTMTRANVRLLGPTRVIRANRSNVPVSLRPGMSADLRAALADVDLIHLHEPLIPLVGWLTLAVARPKVITFHAAPSLGVRRFYRWAAPLLRRLPRTRTAVSTVAAAPVSDLGSITVVPLAIDPEDYRPQFGKDHGSVAFLGRADPRKGLPVLLAAWPAVQAAHPEAQLVVMGAQGQDTPGIRYLGMVGDAPKKLGLGRAQIFCAPNTGGESFGLILLEAMASDCAIVCSDLEAFRAVAGEAALYVQPGDRVDLAETLHRLLGDERLQKFLVAEGNRRIGLFSWETTLAGYLAAYQTAGSRRLSE